MKTEEIRGKLLCDLTPDLADAIMAEIENRDSRPTPMEALISFLMSQSPATLQHETATGTKGDWPKIQFQIKRDKKCDGDGRTLTIDDKDFGFYFNPDGSFGGIFGGERC